MIVVTLISMEAVCSQCTPWFSRDLCYTTSLWKQFIHNVHHCFLMSVVTLHFNQWKKQISHNGHHSFLLVVVSLHLYGSRLFTMHTMSLQWIPPDCCDTRLSCSCGHGLCTSTIVCWLLQLPHPDLDHMTNRC